MSIGHVIGENILTIMRKELVLLIYHKFYFISFFFFFTTLPSQQRWPFRDIFLLIRFFFSFNCGFIGTRADLQAIFLQWLVLSCSHSHQFDKISNFSSNFNRYLSNAHTIHTFLYESFLTVSASLHRPGYF